MCVCVYVHTSYIHMRNVHTYVHVCACACDVPVCSSVGCTDMQDLSLRCGHWVWLCIPWSMGRTLSMMWRRPSLADYTHPFWRPQVSHPKCCHYNALNADILTLLPVYCEVLTVNVCRPAISKPQITYIELMWQLCVLGRSHYNCACIFCTEIPTMFLYNLVHSSLEYLFCCL